MGTSAKSPACRNGRAGRSLPSARPAADGRSGAISAPNTIAPPAHGRASRCRRDNRQLKADRKSVVEGKSVSVRVDIGGRRIIKKKTQKQLLVGEELKIKE